MQRLKITFTVQTPKTRITSFFIISGLIHFKSADQHARNLAVTVQDHGPASNINNQKNNSNCYEKKEVLYMYSRQARCVSP